MSVRQKSSWLTRQLSGRQQEGTVSNPPSNHGSLTDLHGLFGNHERSMSSLASALAPGGVKSHVLPQTGTASREPLDAPSIPAPATGEIATESLLGLRMLHSHSSLIVGPNGNIIPTAVSAAAQGETPVADASRPSDASRLPRRTTNVPAPAPDREWDESLLEKRNAVLEWVFCVLDLQPGANKSVPSNRADATALDRSWSELVGGELACTLLNVIRPNSCVAVSRNAGTVAALENLHQVTQAIQAYAGDTDEVPLFKPLDLVNGSPKARLQLLLTLTSLALAAHKRGLPVPRFKPEVFRAALGPLSAAVAVAANEPPSESSGLLDVAPQRGTRSRTVSAGESSSVNPSRRQPSQTHGVRAPSRLVEVYGPSGGASSSSSLKVTNPNNRISSEHPPATDADGPLALLADLAAKLERFEQTGKTQTAKMDQLSEKVMGAFDSLLSRLAELESRQTAIQTTLNSVANAPAGPQGGLFTRDGTMFGVGGHSRTASTSLPLGGLAHGVRSRLGTETSSDSLAVDGKPSMVVAGPAPKVFGRLPKEVEELGLSPKEKRRQTAIYELIDSEDDYVRDLQLMVTLHMVEYVRAGVVSEENAARLFCNAEQVLGTNQQFLARLRQRAAETPCIENVGDLITEATETFKDPYVLFCAKYGDAMKYYKTLANRKEAQQAILAIKMHPASRGLTLEGFLIKPVQRICKYPLLIREILKATEEEHPSRGALQAAAAKMDEVVAKVNEEIRAFENKEKLLRVQHRLDGSVPFDLGAQKLVLEGNLQRVLSNGVKDRYVMLLDECLLVLKAAVMNKSRLTMEHCFYLQDLVLPATAVASSPTLASPGGPAGDTASIHSQSTASGVTTAPASLPATPGSPALPTGATGLHHTPSVVKTKQWSFWLANDTRKEPFTFACSTFEEQQRWSDGLAESVRRCVEARRERQAAGAAATLRGSPLLNDADNMSENYADDDEQADRVSLRAEAIGGTGRRGGARLKSRPSLLHRSASTAEGATGSLSSLASAGDTVSREQGRGFLGLRRKASQLRKLDSYSEEQGAVPSDQSPGRSPTFAPSAEEDDEDLVANTIPEHVEYQGATWHRAQSATGDYYWYNKTTRDVVWTLPDEALAALSAPKKRRPTAVGLAQAADALVNFVPEDGVSTVPVAHMPDWVCIQRPDSVVYYYHIPTDRVEWVLPVDAASGSVNDERRASLGPLAQA